MGRSARSHSSRQHPYSLHFHELLVLLFTTCVTNIFSSWLYSLKISTWGFAERQGTGLSGPTEVRALITGGKSAGLEALPDHTMCFGGL